MTLSEHDGLRFDLDRHRQEKALDLSLRTWQEARERRMKLATMDYRNGVDDARANLFPRLRTPDYMSGYKSVNPTGFPIAPPHLRY